MAERPARALLAAGIAGTAVHLGYVLFAPAGFLETRCIVDDTFYYWMIARRFWEAGFFTFDGIHPTNGFQPLWQWLLLPLGLLNRAAQMRASLLLAALFYQAAAWMLALWKAPREDWRIASRIAALTLWANARFVFEYASSGMEFGLYLFVAVWALIEFLRLLEATPDGGTATSDSFLRFAFATGILPLARIDGIGLSVLLWLVALLRVRALGRPFLLAGFAVSLIPFAILLAWNHAMFNSALPISGTVKRLDRINELAALGVAPFSAKWFAWGLRDTATLVAGNVLRFASGWLPHAPWSRLVLVVIGALSTLIIAAAGFRTIRNARGAYVPAAMLLAFGGAQALVYAFAIPNGVQYAQWYYGPFYVGLALAAGAALAYFERILPRIAAALILVQTVVLFITPPPTQIACAGAQPALDALAKEANGQPLHAGSWNAGVLAFHAPDNVTIENLDGLVNSTLFAHEHAAGRDVRPYLAKNGVAYLIDYAVGSEKETWEQILPLRLGIDSHQAVVEATPMFVGELPAEPNAEPRRYHVLAIRSNPASTLSNPN